MKKSYALSLPKDWEIKKLGEICEIGAGNSAPQKKEMFDGGVYPFIRTSDVGKIHVGYITDSADKLNVTGIQGLRFYKKGTLLFPKSGASTFLNHRVLMNIDGYVSSHLATIKAKNEFLDDHFLLFYSINIDSKDLMQDQNYPSLRLSDIRQIKIPIPPLPEQKRIVSILDKVFSVIERSRNNAEQNLKNVKELFESYLNGIFEEKGEDWEENKLGEVCVKTETVNPKLEPEKKFVYIDVSSVNKETKIIEETTILLGKDAPSRARKLVKTDDVIFATVRPTHQRVALITNEYNNQVCSTGYYILRPIKILNSRVIYYFLLTYHFNEEMEELQKGASYPAVTNKDVENQTIPFPKSIDEQKRIVTKLDGLQAETKKLEAIYQKKIEDLEELKKSILQKTFSGEL